MRILRADEWGGLVGQCPHCGIRVLITAEDVLFSLERNSFCFDCSLCGGTVLLNKTAIPANVQVSVLLQNNKGTPPS